MRVLLVHEYYRSINPSGENKVFEREKYLLEKNGIKVDTLVFHNDCIGSLEGPSVINAALLTPWSSIGTYLVKKIISKNKPDLVHFHNTFPIISQSAIYQAKKMGVATVQTLHNFRSVCAQAMLMRNGKICEDCLGHYPWPALRFRCYRNSFASTLPLFANIALHRLLKTWRKKIDRFIVLSDFNKFKLSEAGLPKNKIRVKPNFFFDIFPSDLNKNCREWLFIGRIGKEKGVHLLPYVWHHLGPKAPFLNIIGDGPEIDDLIMNIKRFGLEKKLAVHGFCSTEKVNAFLKKASLLVFPSIWYETFGLVIGEAYSAGVAVAASKLGTPQFIVRDQVTGIHFRPGDISDMVEKLSFLIDNPQKLLEMGKNARESFNKNYTEDNNFKLIYNIYEEAIKENIHSGLI